MGRIEADIALESLLFQILALFQTGTVNPTTYFLPTTMYLSVNIVSILYRAG